MPWKLISFIICIVLVTVFIGFNLDNRCNISFGFFQLEGVPIFFSLMAAFVLGVVVVLPFTFGKKKQKNQSVHQAQGGDAGSIRARKLPAKKGVPVAKNTATSSATEASPAAATEASAPAATTEKNPTKK